MPATGAGLEGVVATSSKICYIEGNQGILSYFGYNIHTLADNATFEEVIYLLWNGRLPKKNELAELKSALVAERELPEEIRNKGPRDVLAHVFSQCEARQADWRWQQEIEKYFPQLAVMSFLGPEPTIRWLMERVCPREADARLANRLKAIEKSDLPPDQKARARLEAVFQNLKGGGEGEGDNGSDAPE